MIPGKKEIKRINPYELVEYERITSNNIPGEHSDDYQKPTILIADDEHEFRRIIKSVLQKNYRILEVSNGTDALEYRCYGRARINHK